MNELNQLSERGRIKRLEQMFDDLYQKAALMEQNIFSTIGAVSFHVSVLTLLLKDKGMINDPEIETAAKKLQDELRKRAEEQAATTEQENRKIVVPGAEEPGSVILSQDELTKMGEAPLEEKEPEPPGIQEPDKPDPAPDNLESPTQA